MEHIWRVACVRIPRFPIGAVWRASGGRATSDVQLSLSLSSPADASSPASDGAPTPTILPGRPGPPPASASRVLVAPWDELPIALLVGARLRAISSAAARARVRTGMTPAEARARCAGLDVLPWDEACIARAITGITGQLLAASPQVTPARGEPGMWWVGASGF